MRSFPDKYLPERREKKVAKEISVRLFSHTTLRNDEARMPLSIKDP